MSHKISVVIPYFNDAPVIERCLKSVLNQTHLPDQIIIVDDCSDDSSVLLDIVANTPSEIEIVLHRNDENKNGAYSRNYGCKLAIGDYIAFLDGDDYWIEQHLELSLKTALETDADFVYSNVVNIDVNCKRSIRKVTDISTVDNQPDVLFMSPPQTNSFFFKKSLCNEVAFNEKLRRHQDYQFLIDLILAKKHHVYGSFSTACYCESHRPFDSRIDIDSILNFWSIYANFFTQSLLKKQLVLVFMWSTKQNIKFDDLIVKHKVLNMIKNTCPISMYYFLGVSNIVVLNIVKIFCRLYINGLGFFKWAYYRFLRCYSI